MLANRVRMSVGGGFQDTTGSPGPVELIAGDENAGFFGEVPVDEFYDGREIATAANLTGGFIFNDDEPWLKFVIDGKIIFKSKKPYRYNISWDSIDRKGCAYGTTTVTKDGVTYKVRLMKGALTDPSKYSDPDQGAIGSEWNRLMLPISEHAPSSWGRQENFVDSPTEDWGINYSDRDLGVVSGWGNGARHWCQEKSDSSSREKVSRGSFSVADSSISRENSSSNYYGWSPVLEVVG